MTSQPRFPSSPSLTTAAALHTTTTPSTKGAKSGDKDDEMCVKVQSVKISVPEEDAARKLQEFIFYEAKGIDGPYTGRR